MGKISTVRYKKNLRTVATHLRSNQEITTDAPVDNHGQGQAFSPTDMAATSLATCMITIMGIHAEQKDIDLGNIKADVIKNMESDPRKIGEIGIDFSMSDDIPEGNRKELENAAKNCPVALSLHPSIKQLISFTYE